MKEDCKHEEIDVTDMHEGVCSKCGVEMVKEWVVRPIPKPQ